MSTRPLLGWDGPGDEASVQYNLYLHTVLVPPLITGPRTVNESDDLTLRCDPSASLPVDRFYWVMPNRSVLMNVASIVLTNIMRSSSGNYTCNVQDDRNNTVSSTVTITVQCKSVQEWDGNREEEVKGYCSVVHSQSLIPSAFIACNIFHTASNKSGSRGEKLRKGG